MTCIHRLYSLCSGGENRFYGMDYSIINQYEWRSTLRCRMLGDHPVVQPAVIMNTRIRLVLAAVTGVVAAFIIVAGVEALGHALYPPPPGLDLSDSARFAEYVRSIPIEALLFVIVAWFAGTLGGGLVAIVVARRAAVLPAGIVAGLLLAGAIVNLVAIRHPIWFAFVGVAAIILGFVLAMSIGRRLEARG